jgi:NAD(P)-dependent dehydrogenase (short-subunit alcohol dehydrogenase family)
MFDPRLMAGQRILVTGGGTASARRWPSSSFASAPTSRSAAGASRSATRPRPVATTFPSAGSTPSASTSATRQAVEEMVESLWQSGGLTGLVNNAAGNFVAPTESLSPRAFDAIANIVFHGTFYVTQAIGKRWVDAAKSGAWTPTSRIAAS